MVITNSLDDIPKRLLRRYGFHHLPKRLRPKNLRLKIIKKNIDIRKIKEGWSLKRSSDILM